MLVEALEKHPGRWPLAAGFRAFVGGTAAPESLFRRMDRQGIRLIHIWGMTETTPVAVCSTLKGHMREWSEDEQYRVRSRQGRPLPLIDARVMGHQGEVPWDGMTFGELQVRGPWVASRYFATTEPGDQWTRDGWLRTGDVATIDSEGYVQIVDRTKDLIKSGGEWISSVDLESALAAHPSIREAAVIAVRHPKWDERPLAVVVVKDGAAATAEDLRAFLSARFAKWQIPDAFLFVEDLPHTSTGKLSKRSLREQYSNWDWGSAAAGLSA
jgi:fatty-acyl-CoA synthase